MEYYVFLIDLTIFLNRRNLHIFVKPIDTPLNGINQLQLDNYDTIILLQVLMFFH